MLSFAKTVPYTQLLSLECLSNNGLQGTNKAIHC